MSFGVFQLGTTIDVTDLWGLINSLNINTNTFRVVRILRVVSIKVSYSLFKAASSLPVPNKGRNFFGIHE
jgi:hypothetical protein